MESKLYIVEDSDHHMYFDNPEHFLKLILDDLKAYLPKKSLSTRLIEQTE